MVIDLFREFQLFLEDTLRDFPANVDTTTTLDNIFANLQAANINSLTKFCAINYHEKNINTLFIKYYNPQISATKKIMADFFIETINSTSKKAFPKKYIHFSLENISKAINKDFFDDATLKSADFDPFSKGVGKTLLYSLVNEYSSLITIKDLRKITDVLKVKGNFSGTPGDSWNEYLAKDTPQSTVDLVDTITKDNNITKVWLQMD